MHLPVHPFNGLQQMPLLKWDDQLCEHVFFWFCWMTDHMTTSSRMSPQRTARYAPQLSAFWSEGSKQIVQCDKKPLYPMQGTMPFLWLWFQR